MRKIIIAVIIIVVLLLVPKPYSQASVYKASDNGSGIYSKGWCVGMIYPHSWETNEAYKTTGTACFGVRIVSEHILAG